MKIEKGLKILLTSLKSHTIIKIVIAPGIIIVNPVRNLLLILAKKDLFIKLIGFIKNKALPLAAKAL